MKKNIKPIVVIKVPSHNSQEHFEEMRNSLKESVMSKDYYFLIFPDDINEVDVKIFFDKDIEEKKIEDLHKDILETLNKK